MQTYCQGLDGLLHVDVVEGLRVIAFAQGRVDDAVVHGGPADGVVAQREQIAAHTASVTIGLSVNLLILHHFILFITELHYNILHWAYIALTQIFTIQQFEPQQTHWQEMKIDGEDGEGGGEGELWPRLIIIIIIGGYNEQGHNSGADLGYS